MISKVTGKGPPLVLIPGGIAGWLSLEEKQDRLATTRKVIRLQLINVQRASEQQPLEPDYSVQTEIEALSTTFNELGLTEPVDIVAWAYGSVVALNYAANNPTRVNSLIVV